MPKVHTGAKFDKFQTGDILLFHGDELPSQLIEFVTDSKYSHSAMVFRQPDGPYVWQSYHDTGGVGLTPLNEFLLMYEKGAHARKPDVWVRHLAVKRSHDMLEALAKIIKKETGKPFPSVFDFGRDFFEGRVEGKNSGDSSFFCSQLVAATYQVMGLLKTKHPPNWYTPEDFSTRHKLHLQLGAKLGPEIQIPLSHQQHGAKKPRRTPPAPTPRA